jgi:hypothetical protein
MTRIKARSFAQQTINMHFKLLDVCDIVVSSVDSNLSDNRDNKYKILA